MSRPQAGQKLCAADQIGEGEARGFSFGQGVERFEMFVLRKDGRLHAYVNECPHARSSLDWQPDRFFDAAGRHLLCGTHGALFRPEDGYCVAGPCLGRSLTRVAIRVEANQILLA